MTKPINQVQREAIQQLVALRIKLKLTQRDMVIRTRLDRKTVQRLESGRDGTPRLTTLQRYAAALDMEIVFTFTPKEHTNE
jgi:transcriptional regulator with XRE-family HTH domain